MVGRCFCHKDIPVLNRFFSGIVSIFSQLMKHVQSIHDLALLGQRKEQEQCYGLGKVMY